MPRCAACPLGPGLRCPSEDRPSWCRNAALERARPDPRQHYWLDRIRAHARPTPAPTPGAAPLGPSPDGRVRVGIVSPTCYIGGAELWVGHLLDRCDGSRVAWQGVAVRDDATPIVAEVRADWEAHGPVDVGPEAIRGLAARCDVLVCWGVFQTWGFPADKFAPLVGRTPLLYVSHGAMDHCLVPPGGLLPRTTAAAVSRAALRGVPAEFRRDARVIPNMVTAARVATTRPAAETRAMLGVPEGMRVAGWLGRYSPEKRPEAFVRAVAALPEGWAGVMAGIGWIEPQVRRMASEIAPGRVLFAGGRHDVGDLLGLFDCLVMPSETEACSLAASEAWLAGVPLVSTPVGVLEEHPQLARIVAHPATPGDLAAAILADHADRAGTAARAASARDWARDHLSPGRFGREWTDLICSLAPPPPAPARRAPADPRLAMAAELCVSGSGHCGCGAVPRDCGRPDRPAKVFRPTCLSCQAAGWWEAGVEAGW